MWAAVPSHARVVAAVFGAGLLAGAAAGEAEAAAAAATGAGQLSPGLAPPAGGPPSPGHGLLEEIADAWGAGERAAYLQAARKELPDMEAGLRQILATVPRREGGRLAPAAVGYALHHYFLRLFHWHIKGLGPMGESWSTSSPPGAPASALDRLPARVRDSVRKRLDGPGFDDRDVAALGATLRYLVRGESTERLRLSYGMLGLPLTEALSEERAADALQLSMASFSRGEGTSTVAPRGETWSATIRGGTAESSPGRNRTARLVHEVLAASRRGGGGPGARAGLDFSEVARVAAVIDERARRSHEGDCKVVRDGLLALEDRGTGRVRLTEFYAAELNGNRRFSDSMPRLRRLGVLDESAPGDPRVIIPNYIGSAPNCAGVTPYYDLCCASECEALLGHLERSLASHTAAPDDIAREVAALSSPAVLAHRVLDAALLQRLRVLASEHEGAVPLYGQPFARWMHSAFPRECPYPGLANETRPPDPSDFTTRGEVEAWREEVRGYVVRTFRKAAPLHTNFWVKAEKVFVPTLEHHLAVGCVEVQFVTALTTLSIAALSLVRTVLQARRQLRIEEVPKLAQDHFIL